MTAKLAKKLGKLREQKKISAETVAAQLNIHPIKLKSWERAKSLPDDETLVKLAEIYDVPAEELLSIVQTDRAVGYTFWGKFPYPTIVTALYIFYGLYTNSWHPAWLVLLTVPLYRRLGEYFVKKDIFTKKDIL